MKFIAALFAGAGLACAADFVTGQAARAVIGQSNFTSQTPGVSEFVVGAVGGLAYANGTLFVVDSSRVPAAPQNQRVLLFKDLQNELPGRTAELQSDSRCPLCLGTADVVLGQPDFTKSNIGLTSTTFRTPTAVATDGRYIAVADTDNNRVLIWNSIPASNGVPADVVIGQENFTTGFLNFGGSGNTPSAKGLRGPQGVWIQNGRLFVADTQNHRVLIWNNIPTQNGQAADVVLGKPNFTTFIQPDLTQAGLDATPSSLNTPVSVTSDGIRLYIADLGHNRVLVWNSVPTSNAAPADFALGQPDVASTTTRNAAVANNSSQLCASNGKDADGKDTFPPRCAATLEFPRFALSDGKRLFIADGGNNRILVFNSIPTRSGQPADAVLGQITDQLSQDTEDLRKSAADAITSPMSLAWDGENLYASDPFNRRVLVFTVGDQPLPGTGVRNAASIDIFAVGSVVFTTAPKENDEITLKIGDKEYKYKAVANDDIPAVINALVGLINAGEGDPLVFARPNVAANLLLLTARVSGIAGEGVAWTVTLSTGAQLAVSAASGTLTGGQDAAKIAPGTLVSILGENLADSVAAAPDADSLPTKLAGVEVYIDGRPAPLQYVSPGQINAQMPWEVFDAYSVSAYVRTVGKDGTVRTTTAIAVPIIPQNPGIFAQGGTDPRPAIALHGGSYPTGVITVGGTIKEGEVATIRVEDREYTYTVKAADTLETVRDALIAAVDQDEKVTASVAGAFNRIVLQARTPGPEGEAIGYGASVPENSSLTLSALSGTLCCANFDGAPITPENPARPGETIVIYATGLGMVQPDPAKWAQVTGGKYYGPQINEPNAFLDAIAGGKTANIVFGGLKQGAIGLYELRLQLNTDIPTNPQTQLTIAQDIFISNIVTFPVVNPNTPVEE